MNKLTILLFTILSACVSAPKDPCTPELVKSKDTRTTTGRWLMFNKKHFQTKVGDKPMPQSARGMLMQNMAAKNFEKLDGLNAYAFEANPNEKQAFTLASMAVNDEWVFQREYVHHVLDEQLYKIVPASCPGPGPAPEPGPAPQPTPGPVGVAKSWGVTRVHALEAMAKVDTTGVKICDVDTGIDLQHPNKGAVLATQDFTGKGSVQDGAGHGSHTAGTLAGNGGVGVSRAKLLICKGLSDSGSGTSSALAQCLNWCGQQGAQIVSNSWGSSQSDPMINQAIAGLTAKGIYVFIAAGNDSGPVNWPAALARTNSLVYAIAASGQNDQITSFSSRGPEVRYISPGEGIVSNWPGGSTKSLSGTSMATPHVAAICAFGLVKGKRPCVTASGSVSSYPFADAAASAQ